MITIVKLILENIISLNFCWDTRAGVRVVWPMGFVPA